VHAHERFLHRLGEHVVHREPLAGPVQGRPEALELVEDFAAVRFLREEREARRGEARRGEASGGGRSRQSAGGIGGDRVVEAEASVVVVLVVVVVVVVVVSARASVASRRRRRRRRSFASASGV
jgi:hypothetical protein